MTRRRRSAGIAAREAAKPPSDRAATKRRRSTVTANLASIPTSRKRPRMPAGSRGPAYTPAGAAREFSRSVNRGAAAFRAGAEAGPIHEVLTRPRKREKPSLFTRTVRAVTLPSERRVLGRIAGRAHTLAASTRDPGYKHLGDVIDALRAAPEKTHQFLHASERPTPKKAEKLTDTVAGKAAGNLIFHGETSHLPEAGLEIGSLFPVFRGAKLTGKAAAKAAAKAGERAPAEIEAVRYARPPRGPAAVAAPAPKPVPPPAKTAEERVREALGPARARRAAQQGLYREERSRRIAVAEAASKAAGGGIAGYRAAGAELAGELPKVKFEHLREGTMTQAELDDVFRAVQDHPDLQPFQKRSAMRGLLDAFEHGRVPQPAQLKLLQTVFGQDAAAEIVHASRLRKAKHLTMEGLNVPRALMATLDLSAPFRQGLVAGAAHPRLFAKNFKPMVKAAGNEKAFQAVMDDIAARPNAPLYEDAKLALTDLTGNLDAREEQWLGENLAEKIPVAGRGIRGSARAYTGFLNKMRADVFDRLIAADRAKGVNVEDRRYLRDLGRYVNAATGRGGLGPLESWGPALNTMLFSPRLMASRINFLNPAWYASLHPAVRRHALAAAGKTAAGGAAVLGAGSYAGAQVGVDPRSADFAKLKIGDTRIDVLGGFQQYIRAASQIGSGKIVSSTSGKTMTLGPGFGQLSRKDIAERFVAGKLAPVPSFAYTLGQGSDISGQPVNVPAEAARRLIPLGLQGAYETYQQTAKGRSQGEAAAAALGGFGLSSVGFGVQSYGDQTKARQKKRILEKAEGMTPAERDKFIHDEERKLRRADWPPERRAVAKVYDKRQEYYEAAVRVGVLREGGKQPDVVRRAFEARATRERSVAELSAALGRDLTKRERYLATVGAVRKLWGPKEYPPEKVKAMLSWAMTASDSQLESETRWQLANRLGGNTLKDWTRTLNQRGADVSLR